MSSDIHSKFRQLTAYLQLSAEGPFSACGRTLETYARHVKTPGFSPQTMMDGEWVDKGPSAFVCQLDNSVSQGDPTGRSLVTQTVTSLLILFLLNLLFYFIFFLLYNVVLVLPYINMNQPWVYTCSPSWNPLPPPSPYHPSGSSHCTSPKHPVSCIELGLVIHLLYDIIHTFYWFNIILCLTSPLPANVSWDHF